MHEAGRVVRDRSDADARAGPAHEVAGRVEQHLVAVDVGVVVRHLDGVRDGSRSSRGTNEQTTKPGPSNVWCTGGGWWMRPTIGSKSWIEKAYGYRQPSQPTTSNGWSRWTWRLSPPARCARATVDVVAVDEQRLGRRRAGRARSTARLRGTVRTAPRYLPRRSDVAAAGLDHERLDDALVDHPAMRRRRGDHDVVAGRRRRATPNDVSSRARPDWTYTQLVADARCGTAGSSRRRGADGDASRRRCRAARGGRVTRSAPAGERRPCGGDGARAGDPAGRTAGRCVRGSSADSMATSALGDRRW